MEIVGVVTLPERPSSVRTLPLRRRRCEVGAEYVETNDLNADSTLNTLRKLDPELVFVVGWYQLVHEPFIASAREGVFGCTRRCCPGTAGRASIPWALLSGLARTG